MCVAAFAWQAHPDWLLVAIGNRDEYHERPAAALTRWNDVPGILAGRDLRLGGTWLGVNEAGCFALVTNRRGYGDPNPERVSRGELVIDQLAGSGTYSDPERAKLNDFNPFNLISANRDEAQFLSNRPDAIRTALSHGIYGLSNGALDEPWPKTLQLKGALLDWLNTGTQEFDPLFAALSDKTMPDLGVHTAQPSDVRREAPETGVFIRDPVYGTRCSTIVAIDRAGGGQIVERSFSAAGDPTGETRIEFRWPR